MTDFVIVQAHDPSVTKYRNINDSQLRNLGCHCEAEGRGNPGRLCKDLEKNMTAIEFENISKQYRLGLVSTGSKCTPGTPMKKIVIIKPSL